MSSVPSQPPASARPSSSLTQSLPAFRTELSATISSAQWSGSVTGDESTFPFSSHTHLQRPSYCCWKPGLPQFLPGQLWWPCVPPGPSLPSLPPVFPSLPPAAQVSRPAHDSLPPPSQDSPLHSIAPSPDHTALPPSLTLSLPHSLPAVSLPHSLITAGHLCPPLYTALAPLPPVQQSAQAGQPGRHDVTPSCGTCADSHPHPQMGAPGGGKSWDTTGGAGSWYTIGRRCCVTHCMCTAQHSWPGTLYHFVRLLCVFTSPTFSISLSTCKLFSIPF